MSWLRHHPSDIPDRIWAAWLSRDNACPPYLIPHWALFWESLWPGTHAEVWTLGSPGPESVALLGVRRPLGLIWNRFHAQPFGTPGGFYGLPRDKDLDDETVSALWNGIAAPRTVEVTFNLNRTITPPDDWRYNAILFTRWVRRLKGAEIQHIEGGYSESHRRNIQMGVERGVTTGTITSAGQVRDMIVHWKAPLRHPSRLVLNTKAGPLLARSFSGSSALHWRVAYLQETPVATCLWLVLNDRAVYVDGASSSLPNANGANHFLFSRVLSDLVKRGVREFDFGAGPEGKTSPGLAQFKEGWGARPEDKTELIARRPFYDMIRRVI